MIITLKKSALGVLLCTALLSCKKNEQTPTSEPQTENTQKVENNALTTASFDKEFHDFGTLEKGAIVQHSYEITNTGDKPLIISEVRPECGCTAPEYTTQPIAPGQKGKVTLSFDSKNFSGEVHKTAHIFTNTQNSPIALQFKANIQ